MNGTVVDIPGILITQLHVDLENSTDKSHVLKIEDGKIEVVIEFCFGKITSIKENKCKGR